MKLSKSLLYMLLTALAPFVVTACGDDDEYTAGEAISSDNIQAYFQTTQASANVKGLEAGETATYTYTVARKITSSATSVPLVVEGNEDGYFTVPSSIDFSAGEESKDVTITFNGAKEGSHSITVTFGEEDKSPYDSNVTTVYLTAAIFDEVYCNAYFTFDGYIQPCYQDIYKAGDYYRIKNFLNSGMPLTFTVNSSGAITFVDCTIADEWGYLYFGFKDYDEYGDYYPYLYPSMTVDNIYVSWLDFYPNDDYYTYNYMDTEQNYGGFSYAYMGYYDYNGNYYNEGYNSIYFSW